MITAAEFVRFRGFEKMRAELVPHAYIVGPNSAGKSTVLEAIGLAEICLRIARRKGPSLVIEHEGRRKIAFPLPLNGDAEEDPVRHDFGNEETRVTIEWDTGGRIHMIWPEIRDEEKRGFFYLEDDEQYQPRTPTAVRNLFRPVTIIPVITPLERTEELKDPSYVEKHSDTRLASRHFRNHAWLMSRVDTWENFKTFCRPWLPEIELLDVHLNMMANRLAVFYSETGSRVPKELAWAGDGIQIWVQILWHIYRAQGATTIVLDEPEVYLHPDLQRRLVRILDGISAQVVLASHSADVIAEAPPEGVLWVDRRLGGSRRAKSHQTLSALSASLGTSYNLALARSMRARLVIASDCGDLRIIRQLAKQVGATFIADEHAVSMVQLREMRNWSSIESLGASLREALPQKIPAVVMLEAGNRPNAANEALIRHLSAPGIDVRIWRRAEIENYLLDADTIARVSGAAPEIIAVRISESIARLQESARSNFISEWMVTAQLGKEREVLEEAAAVFDSRWSDSERRIELVRGTQIIKDLNSWLERGGYKPISSYLLAKAIKPHVLTPEVSQILLELDGMLDS